MSGLDKGGHRDCAEEEAVHTFLDEETHIEGDRIVAEHNEVEGSQNEVVEDQNRGVGDHKWFFDGVQAVSQKRSGSTSLYGLP